MKTSLRGTTLVELLVASAILGIGLGAAVSGFSNFYELNKNTTLYRQQSDITSGLVENIRRNVSLYQVNFNHSGKTEGGEFVTDLVLDPENLSFAWSNTFQGEVSECPSCPGRYDYVIQPLEGMNDLFRVTIRITNPQIFKGYRDYVFISGTK